VGSLPTLTSHNSGAFLDDNKPMGRYGGNFLLGAIRPMDLQVGGGGLSETEMQSAIGYGQIRGLRHHRLRLLVSAIRSYDPGADRASI
jgi:hypothetical protein